MNGYRSRWVRAGAGVATLLLGGAGILLGTATAANAHAVVCDGMTAAQAAAAGYTTHDHHDSAFAVIVVTGPGPDWIVGSPLNDILDSQGGNDSICGREGDDDLRGLSGDDTIFGNRGRDTISGGVGVDEGDGGIGVDTCDAFTETQVSC